MASKLTHGQLMEKWARDCKIGGKNPRLRMSNIYESFLNIIKEEVRLYGEINLKNFGKITCHEYGGFERQGVVIGNSETEVQYIEKRIRPHFGFSNNFKDYINDKPVSYEGRRKSKGGFRQTALDREIAERETERRKTQVQRVLDRKNRTDEPIADILKDSRIKFREDIKELKKGK